eukprot:2567511-Alexandrium_andersonii.AAC.1
MRRFSSAASEARRAAAARSAWSAYAEAKRGLRRRLKSCAHRRQPARKKPQAQRAEAEQTSQHA